MRLERAFLAIALTASLAVLAGCGPNTGGSVKKEDAATQRQDAARVHTELGQKYLQQGKLEMALEKLNKALSFDPDYVDAHTVLAVLYENINDPAKAEEHYKRAAQLRPKGGAEQNNYGTFLCKLGRYGESQGYFERALADPFYKTPSVALTNSGSCLLKAGKRDEAEKALRLALEQSPNDGEALIQLASVLYEKGDYFKARAFVQRFEATSQPRPDALLLGRNIELRLGNGRGAGDYTHRLLQGFPDSQQARSLSVQG
ncbi:type IV pilus biogenesis/stability protein PilW [Dokdonella soli]|uniref:Type IV pilus biogenesis/stability protein PilW n=1 Tax=Dokdonella soli TaxID=529810 RepID=A0ABP3TIK7_9GAMM